jgi:serine/threonine-protein kinase
VRRACAVAIVLFARVASAQAPAPAAQDPAAAAELFRQGRAALEAKDYPVACAKLRESLRLDVPHVGTLISLAVCEEATGKIAGARLHWQQAFDLARGRGDERAEYCAQQFAAIDKRVPRLTIRIAPNAPTGTYVRKDGVDVGAAGIDVPLPIEVGAHQIVALAPHHDTNAYPIDAKEGEALSIRGEPGAALPYVPPAREDLPPTEPALAPTARKASPLEPSLPLRRAAYVAGGFGIVALGIGSYFGWKAIDARSTSASHCVGNICDHDGVVQRQDGITAGNTATALFVVGGLLVGTGVAFWIASSPKQSPTAIRIAPTVGVGAAGMNVAGAW